MRKLMIAAARALAVVLAVSVVACSASGSTAPTSGGTSASSSVSQPTSPVPTSPLEGAWHQRFTCEQNVRTFQRNFAGITKQQRQDLAALYGNTDISMTTLLRETTRQFAWGPHAKTAAQLTPETLCAGAPDRERTIRFQGAALVVNDWDGSSSPAMLEILDGHTFTANDHFGNFGNSVEHPVDNFSFRIDGDTLIITEIHEDDPWAGTMLEVAPWIRGS